jgi:hypothetical protein
MSMARLICQKETADALLHRRLRRKGRIDCHFLPALSAGKLIGKVFIVL